MLDSASDAATNCALSSHDGLWRGDTDPNIRQTAAAAVMMVALTMIAKVAKTITGMVMSQNSIRSRIVFSRSGMVSME